jgi:hypothetical protein
MEGCPRKGEGMIRVQSYMHLMPETFPPCRQHTGPHWRMVGCCLHCVVATYL